MEVVPAHVSGTFLGSSPFEKTETAADRVAFSKNRRVPKKLDLASNLRPHLLDFRLRARLLGTHIIYIRFCGGM